MGPRAGGIMKYPHAPFALLSLFSVACAITPSVDGDPHPPGSAAEAERWSRADDPTRFTANLEERLDRLPVQGKASPIPWTGTYWPAYRDSINFRWAGPRSLSAAEKYALAFGAYGTEELVSRTFGIDAQMNAPFCVDDSQCNRFLHEVCGRRTFQYVGRCTPFWSGICDGWASAAILFPEPTRPVLVNGVTFSVQDIKALLSLVQTSAPRRGVSLMCTRSDDLGGILYDAAGRPLAPECRDTNAGTYHILLANYLGLLGKSFVEDRTFDAQVWNQPLRSFQVLDQRAISAQEANSLIAGVGLQRYLFDPAAQRFAYVKSQVSFVKEARADVDGNQSANIDNYTGYDVYEYVLELDGTGRIIGGEWAGASKRSHPDFLWIPVGPGSAVAGGAIRYAQVAALAAASAAR